jgi:hypothetical protein
MNTQKFQLNVTLFLVMLMLASACQPQSSPANPVAAPTLPPPKVAVETAAPTPVEKGHIQGKANLMAPPTPALILYAVDVNTKAWFTTQTPATELAAAFTLDVAPGDYVVFAAVDGSQTGTIGHWDTTGTQLGVVSVKAGQTVTDIQVQPPGQNECGNIAAVPASPDGRFAASQGPTAGCTAAGGAAASGTEQVTDAGSIQFQPNTTSWYTQGDVAPGQIIRFTLKAMKGQQLTVRLTTEPASPESGVGGLAYFVLKGADGQLFTHDAAMYWSGVLGINQEHIIEVHAATQQAVNYTLILDIPTTVIDPANGDKYDLPDQSLCQAIQEQATQALGTQFTLESRAPFMDAIGSEAGQGCRVTANGNGAQFTSPQEVVAKLLSQMGFEELPNYRADGPTGSAAGAVRDMGLLLITATWKPDMGVVCPSDKPISECNLTPEQKIYTIQLDLALYRATFTLSGHWEDAKTGLSLDLSQTWKNVTGHHLIVAQGGNKIDTLDTTTITGTVQGQVATVQFQSSFASEPGAAQITLTDTNTIQWKITTPPGGEYYLPAEATLTRK